MKVLMFGWEFPPHITGGLGTACYGMTRGLANHGVDVIFVVPKAYGDEDQRAIRLVNASDVEVSLVDSQYKEFWKRIEYMEVGSNIIPYVSPEEFTRIKSQVCSPLRIAVKLACDAAHCVDWIPIRKATVRVVGFGSIYQR